MIICLIQTNKIKAAFKLFNNLIEDDIFFIMNTDLVKDYCPCPQLIYEYENDLFPIGELNHNLILAMLWLYCDVNYSLKYFQKIKIKKIYDVKIEKIVSKLKTIIHN